MSSGPRGRPADWSDDADLAIDPEATTRILTDFISTEVKRTGKQGVVLGLSGGIDSAVAAYLAVPALGRAAVHCVLMPYRTSNPASETDAREIVEALGVPSERVDITPLVEGFTRVSAKVGARRAQIDRLFGSALETRNASAARLLY